MEEQELNMIETKEYQLTPKEIFTINLTKRFKYLKWVSTIAIILGIIFITNNDKGLATILFITGIFTPLIVLFQVYNYSYNNKIFYSTQKISFDSIKLISISDDKSKSEIPKELIIKTETNKKYWFLFLTTKNFIIIPQNIFNTIDDYNLFKSTFIK
jgi:hypothetical protein